MPDPVWPDAPPSAPMEPGATVEANPPVDAGSIEARTHALRARQTNRQAASTTKAHFWTRWTHVYLSLFSFLIVLFFGITGITLNHPSWTFGDEPVIETVTGVLPSSVVNQDGSIEFLLVSEFVRSEHDVAGEIADFGETQDEGTISYKGPAYSAAIFFDTTSLEYSVTTQQQGFVATMNDLHKGRDSSDLWRWVIDLSGGLLVVVGVSGLGIQFFMRKRRRSGLTLAAVGTIVAVILIWITMV